MDTSVRRYVGTTVQRLPPHVGIEKKKRHAERRLSRTPFAARFVSSLFQRESKLFSARRQNML